MGVELAPGALVGGRYRLDRRLGVGGMGSVWAATHTVTLRTVALKFLAAPAHLKAELRKRFLREARAASAINHPNVVQVHDLFELDSETPVMVMDLLEGETLAQLLARERNLLLDEAASIMLQVVSAVGTAHGLGIVHRDLKPDNVFIAEHAGHRIVKVLDFGIAKLSSDNPLITEGGVITNNRTMLGTPCYMAPEQSLGEPDVDHRADVWAIGAMLYEMLAGKRAVDGANVREVLKELLTGSIAPIDSLVPDLPRDVGELVTQMLAYERTERPDDLREVHDMLREYSSVSARTFAAPASKAFEPAASRRPHSSDFTRPNGVTTRPVDPAAETEHDRLPTVAAEPVLDRPVTLLSGSAPLAVDVQSAQTPKAPGRRVMVAAATVAAVGLSIVAWRYASPEPPAATDDVPSRVAATTPEPATPPAPAPLPETTAAPIHQPEPAASTKPSVPRRRAASRPSPSSSVASVTPPTPAASGDKLFDFRNP